VEVLRVDGHEDRRVDDLAAADERDVTVLDVRKRLRVELSDHVVVLLDQHQREHGRGEAVADGGRKEEAARRRFDGQVEVLDGLFDAGADPGIFRVEVLILTSMLQGRKM